MAEQVTCYKQQNFCKIFGFQDSKNMIFSVVTLFRLVGVYRRFGGRCRLCLQSSNLLRLPHVIRLTSFSCFVLCFYKGMITHFHTP
jgi:hypothetical protein